MKAPFPYFGGKSIIAGEVWRRFGDVANFVEPFFGSGAVLLAAPWPAGRIETVNDADALLSNFWRALQADPDAVAYHADWPVSEVDLHARHLALVRNRENVERMNQDPAWFDAKLAGWWVWGISQWIGSGWCTSNKQQLPHLGTPGRGVHRKRPYLGNAGRDDPDDDRLTATTRTADLRAYLRALAERLRRVRICCGDWSRICGPTPTFKQGLTAVFMDPPYSLDERCDSIYAVESDVATAVRDWCIANGGNPLLRIALCGYDSEHDSVMPPSWERLYWKAHGGYGGQGNGRGRENSFREVVWFSPHCLKTDKQLVMFG
jgi:hypothetical protein